MKSVFIILVAILFVFIMAVNHVMHYEAMCRVDRFELDKSHVNSEGFVVWKYPSDICNLIFYLVDEDGLIAGDIDAEYDMYAMEWNLIVVDIYDNNQTVYVNVYDDL